MTRNREPGEAPLARREPEVVEPGDERGFAVAVMGAAVRKGDWDPPEVLYALSLMGGVQLDFRDAALFEGVTEVRIFALMGGVQVIVPPDLDVDARGIGLMGGFTHLSQRAPEAGGPLLRIRGVCLMGGVDVKMKPDEEDEEAE